MINIVNVALKKTTSVFLDGVEYQLNDAAIELCRKFFTFYVLMVGVVVVAAFNLAPLVGAESLFSGILFIIVCLLGFNLLMNYVAEKILKKKVKHE